MSIKRLLASLSLFLAIFFLPGWATLILGLVYFIYFAHYYEGVALALWFDLLYGLPGPVWFNLPLPITLLSLLALLIVTPIRYRVWY